MAGELLPWTHGHAVARPGVGAWLPNLPLAAHLCALRSSGAMAPPPTLGTAAATAKAARPS